MFTSYFAQLRNIDQEEHVPVSICRKPPEWYKGKVLYQTAMPLREYDGKYKVISNDNYRLAKGMVVVISELPISKYSVKLLAPMSKSFGDYLKDRNFDKFAKRYREEVLHRLDAKAIAEVLGNNAVLLCHEADEEECHRSLARQWFNENGVECTIF